MNDAGRKDYRSRPEQTVETFHRLYGQSPKAATNWFYQFSEKNGWTHPYHSESGTWWEAETEYGNLEITFHAENEYGADWLRHRVKQNVSVIPLLIDHTPWFLQYAPYAYCKEHCICVSYFHTPIHANQRGFLQLLDFARQFPHYFCGLDADLPIAGGHAQPSDHFQAGSRASALDRARVETAVPHFGFRDVDVGIVKWPMSVVRIASQYPERLAAAAERILRAWRGYTDTAAMIYAETDGIPHHAATTIVRARDARYELDLVLRNDLANEKNGGIGLIETMGLAAVPIHLKEELEHVTDALAHGKKLRGSKVPAQYAEWADGFRDRYRITAENAGEIVQKEAGAAFVKALECAGVFKRGEVGQKAFLRFLQSVD